MDGDDFRDAAQRHLHDAKLLLDQERLANASHLFGLAAECALKAVAGHFTPTVRFSGRTGHIPQLFAELANASPAMADNPVLVGKIAALEPQFAHWKISERYAAQARFTGARARVLQERAAASAAHLLMHNCLAGLA